MGVVTCGKEMKLVRSPGSYFKNITEGSSKGVLWTFGKKRIYETYISTPSPPQKISSWFSQTHANSKWPQSTGQSQKKGSHEAECF
jgi:hypothetical protein